MAASLDTLEISKRLRQAGFTEPQAETVTAVLRETREFDLAELATKADLALVRADLNGLRSELLARIEAAKSDTIKWVIGIAFAQAATILAVLRFFPGPHG